MDDQNLEDVYLFQLEKVHKQFKKHKTELLKKAGVDITSDQWILIKHINEEEGINQRELAARCFKEPASVTRILDILERKGWVERRALEHNRRAYELYTTQAGKTVIKKIVPLAIEVRAKGREGLSDREVKQLLQMLKQIFKNLQ